MRKGQATLELTVALILIVILLMAGVKVFLWLNGGLVKRQVSYDDTRVAAGSAPPEAVDLNTVQNGEAFDEPLNAAFNIFTTSD